MTSRLNTLRRPRLLIRAARHAVNDYDRNIILPRLVHPEKSQSEEDVLEALLMAEAEVEEQRKLGSATYSIAKHIELLIALMGEARHLSQIRKTA